MLATYLKTTPYPKLILLEDTIDEKGAPILTHIINTHVKFTKNINIQYCQFEFNKNKLVPNVNYFDFIGNANNFETDTSHAFNSIIKAPSIVVIDSLTHMTFKYGVNKTYQILNNLLHKPNVLQIVTIIHTDLLENVNDVNLFKHLSSLSLTLEGNFRSSKRISYIFKKPGGKIINDIEEYYYENGTLITKAVPKLDTKTLLAESVSNVNPQNLSTFKISLGDKDMASRDKLVLPYLPKEEVASEEGQIFYQFDEVDDWDEEDPDDDLDI